MPIKRNLFVLNSNTVDPATLFCDLKKVGGTPISIAVQGPHAKLMQIKGAYRDVFSATKPNSMDFPLCLTALAEIQKYGPVELSKTLQDWATQEHARRELLSVTLKQPKELLNLYAHQNTGVAFILSTRMWNNGKIRCLIGDDMRLGKTVQAIVALREAENVYPCLCLCPKSLTQYWAKQFEQWSKSGIQVTVVKGSIPQRVKKITALLDEGKTHVIITNNEFARYAVEHATNKTFKRFKTLLLDEAHSIRNTKSKISQAVKVLFPVDNIILLTATPIESGPQDYFAYLQLLRPREFRSYWTFVQRFCTCTIGPFGTKIGAACNLELLRDLLEPIMLRREAINTVSIPDKVFTTIELETSAKFKKIYKQIQQDNTIPNMLVRLLKLRQFVAHPPLLGYDHVGSPKMQGLCDLLSAEFSDQPVVVYCSFRDVLEHIYLTLHRKGFNARLYEGDGQTIVDFDNGKFKVFLTTPQMGVGINLATASVIVYYDLPWPITTLRQATERTSTMGKQAPQLIINLVAAPIDKTVAATLTKKRNNINRADICYNDENTFL